MSAPHASLARAIGERFGGEVDTLRLDLPAPVLQFQVKELGAIPGTGRAD